ncbi:GMC oxidoreductase-like protein [Phaeosphaeria sp. MPI-PUGE-AT-0046c]|nr:GMC oxidoreductase-like protein [Phaeosphaeria sp. MPI-PUGE-AT-0046c]
MLSTNVLVQACLLLASAAASQLAATKRQSSELLDSYDFVIAGGGTAGLTVADRLSEAFPKKTILVIEYGDVEYARGVFDPPDLLYGPPSMAPRPGTWNLQSLPNPLVKNKTAAVTVGKTVGGSSSVNGMAFDRPSRFDHFAWAEVSRPYFDESEHKWDWDGIFPYFKKSVTFTEPSLGTVEQHGYTWDFSAFGGTTPIFSSFPPFLWADHFLLRDAWTEMGIRTSKECAGGDKEGVCWMPISQHPNTARRSHSGLGHYASVLPRSNYHLLVEHQVTRVIYSRGLENGPPTVEVRSLANGQIANITVNAEVVIAAGAINTPTILQRSGIGSRTVLDALGIPVFHELPGVGANLQDHGGPALNWNYTKPLNMSPIATDMLNPTFAADAIAGFNETPARGPYTLAMANTGIFVSLPNITVDYPRIIDSIRSAVASGIASSYLPDDYNSDPTLLLGYNRQLSTLANFYANPKAPSIEVPWSTGAGLRAFLLHPLSRGTVRLNQTDHLAPPILDYRAGTNPVDFDIHLAHLKFLRRSLQTPTMQRYGALETGPGSAVQDDEGMLEYIKDSMTLSFLHPCCTAAMLPKELGGVVGPDLKVHGLNGLRVVDISVLPLLVSSHTSTTAYALGEKAADIIIGSWKG